MQFVAFWLCAASLQIVGESAHRLEDRANPPRSGASVKRSVFFGRQAGDQHEHLLTDDLMPSGLELVQAVEQHVNAREHLRGTTGRERDLGDHRVAVDLRAGRLKEHIGAFESPMAPVGDPGEAKRDQVLVKLARNLHDDIDVVGHKLLASGPEVHRHPTYDDGMDPQRRCDLIDQSHYLERPLDEITFPRHASQLDSQLGEVSCSVAHKTNLFQEDDDAWAFCPCNCPCTKRFGATATRSQSTQASKTATPGSIPGSPARWLGRFRSGHDGRYPEVMADPRDIELVFAPQEEGGYHVYAPDLPGLHSEGDTFDEAMENAREALELYVEGLREVGRERVGAGHHVPYVDFA
jgi:predicted RNase H-like HicB family nuclease